jgi:dTDP-4-dehydrorhamnose 3,5-epimerase
MKVEKTGLPGVLKVTPDLFEDQRGYFFEAFRAERYEAHGIPGHFAQDSVSRSRHGVLRGLHFQWPSAQGKLVYVLEGEVFDVAVDVRPQSRTFRQWAGHKLSAENREQLWIPPGFAHGFSVLSDTALFAYKCTTPYDAKSEQAIRWDDKDLAIDWPIEAPTLSKKDAAAPRLREIDPSRLPR